MVRHKVCRDGHASTMNCLDKPCHIFPCTKVRVNLLVIQDVIPVVLIGKIKWRNHHVSSPQLLNIAEFTDDAFQVSTFKASSLAFTVTARKAVYHDVVDHRYSLMR